MKLPGDRMKLELARIGSSLRTRSFRAGGYSVFAALVVVAIAVAVNVLVNALPAGITQFDTTAAQLFSISEQTKSMLKGLQDGVKIYWIVQGGQEDGTLEILLKRYQSLSNQISVEKRDPDTYPAFVRQYTEGAVYNNSFIVESAGRHTFVSHEDIYAYDYTDYYSTGSYDLRFAGECALTSAIGRVIGEDLPKLYILTGHGEPSVSAAFKSAVERENMEVEELSLLAEGEVPGAAGCILEALMGYYGVSAQRGLVVEGHQSNYALGMPYCLLPNIESHAITAPLSEGGYHVLLPLGQGLTVGGGGRETVSIAELLTTSGSAFSKAAGYALDSYEKEEGDVGGPFALAVAITEMIAAEKETRIVWVSSASLLDDQTNMRVSGGNQDLFLNSIHWLCGEERGISIHAKSLAYDYLTMDSGTSSLLTLLIVGLLPLGYLGFGISTWVRRKRR